MLVERTPRSAARAPAAQAAAAQPIAEEPTAPTVEPVELLVDKDAMLEEMESMFEMAVVKVVCTALHCCAVLCCAVLCCAVLCCVWGCVCMHARARFVCLVVYAFETDMGAGILWLVVSLRLSRQCCGS